jgi:hypothetical protein
VGSDQESPVTSEAKYFVLGGTTNPYLLARIHWPDVAQAITAGCRDWLDDPGLFDLPYEPVSAEVTLDRAVEIATSWGASLPTDGVFPLELIRRMPANWSNLSPAELTAWSLEFALRSRRAEGEETAVSAKRASRSERRRSRRSRGEGGPEPVPVVAASTSGPEEIPEDEVLLPAPGPERRRHPRVPVGGWAQIRYGHDTVSADIVDFSAGGVHWVVLDSNAAFQVGERLDAPFVLEGDGSQNHISLDVGGTVIWHSDTRLGTHFGVAFEQLSDEQVERVQHLLVTSGAERD